MAEPSDRKVSLTRIQGFVLKHASATRTGFDGPGAESCVEARDTAGLVCACSSVRVGCLVEVRDRNCNQVSRQFMVFVPEALAVLISKLNFRQRQAN